MRGPFGDFKKNLQKCLNAEKKAAQKFLFMGGTRTRPSAWQTSKNPPEIRSRSYLSVAASGSQLIKLIKAVTSLV